MNRSIEHQKLPAAEGFSFVGASTPAAAIPATPAASSTAAATAPASLGVLLQPPQHLQQHPMRLA